MNMINTVTYACKKVTIFKKKMALHVYDKFQHFSSAIHIKMSCACSNGS